MNMSFLDKLAWVAFPAYLIYVIVFHGRRSVRIFNDRE